MINPIYKIAIEYEKALTKKSFHKENETECAKCGGVWQTGEKENHNPGCPLKSEKKL